MALMTVANGAAMVTETIFETGSCTFLNWPGWVPT